MYIKWDQGLDTCEIIDQEASDFPRRLTRVVQNDLISFWIQFWQSYRYVQESFAVYVQKHPFVLEK